MRPGVVKAVRIGRWFLPLFIILLALGFKTILDRRQEAQAEAPPIPVRTQLADRGDLVRSLRLNGYVESESMVTVLPLVSGVLQEIFVEAGQAVTKNQIIARIDSARYELQLRQAEAAFFSARSTFERVQQLYQAGASSQQNFDQAKAQYDAYATQYELARLQLDYAQVKSPVDGVVLIRHLSAGSIAAPERPLVTIGDLSDLVVRARIPERYYEQFLDQAAAIPISARSSGGLRIPGRVRSVSPFVSAETKNFETIIALDDPEGRLRPGMFLNLEFELRRWPDVASLPFEALAGGNSLWYVEDGLARRVHFEPTETADKAFVLPEGLADREFIIEGHYFVYEGAPVRLVQAGARP